MDDIAIVGMGCLFPGAETPEKFWQNLIDKNDSATFLTEEELGADPAVYYNDVKGTPDKISYSKNGHAKGFEFDSNGYSIPAADLDSLDNLFKWTIYAAEQALIDAGLRGLKDQGYGLILGNIGMPTHSGKRMLNKFYHNILEPYIQDLIDNKKFKFNDYWSSEGLSAANLSTASYNAIIAAQALNLNGPCYTLDAACSSAIYAIKTASYYLNSGKADVMLAGSVCHADHIYIDHGFNVLQAFPGLGEESIPFDKNSKGLKAGEGAGVVVLKRLRDAERDNDRIYGVIESIGLSNDAGAKHILVPDFGGQVLALDRAYAKLDADIDYLECHATGTPVGDQVELNSIEHFFSGSKKMPLLGANKGNVGHMLTASGMASILKVLLGMKHSVIPGTIQLNDMVVTKGGKITRDDVVRETTPWPQTNQAKRAGINAFGFGGVNGHMVMREHIPNSAAHSPPLETTIQTSAGMSIVGMSVAMASANLLDEFDSVVRDGKQLFNSLPETRWSGMEARPDILSQYGINAPPIGSYIEKFEFDCKRFRLPPNMAGLHLLSHMSLMQIAAGAFYDAGYTVDGERRNIAVIVAGDNDYICYRYQARNEMAWQVRDSMQQCGIQMDEEKLSVLEGIVKDSLFPEPYAEGITGGIGNVVASRISAVLKLNGPAFTVCSQENSVFKAMELADFMLSLDEVEAVILGSGSFCGGLENVLFSNMHKPLNTGKPTMSFDQQCNGWNVGEGGGVIVLKRKDRAQAESNRIYANVRAMEFVQDNSHDSLSFQPNSEALTQAAVGCLKAANVTADEIGYVEAHSSGYADEDRAEVESLTEVYSKSAVDDERRCVVGSIKSNCGHLGSASGIASVIKTALCLYNNYLPGTPNWSRAKYPELWEKSRLTVTDCSQEWNVAQNGQKRIAAINSMGMDRCYVNLVLQEPDEINRPDIKFEFSEEEFRKGSLVKTIYIGGEVTIPNMIVNQKNRERMGIFPGTIPATDSDIPQAQQTTTEKVAILDVVQKPRIAHSTPEVNTVAQSSYRSRAGGMQLQEYIRNAETQLRYLQVEQQFYRRVSELLIASTPGGGAVAEQLGDAIVGGEISDPADASADKIYPSVYRRDAVTPIALVKTDPPVLFDQQQLIEMTDGKVENVLGSWYAEADQYPVRTRMPSPPYMFVSRINKLTAQQGKLEPCVVEWELDLPPDAWYVYHGLVPAFVSLESSHAMIVAFTYIGCDQLFRGELCYRAIDSQTTIYSALPKAGETLRGRVDIKSFVKAGKNILITYEYDGFVGDRHAFKLEASSGFFPQKVIKKSKGIKTENIFSKAIKAEPFKPLMSCEKSSFSEADIAAVQNGDLESCFGQGYGPTIVPGLFASDAKMLDRIVNVDSSGGAWGLGTIMGECDIDPSHWVFKAHFKNDPVMPGTFIVEGCEQVLKFYLYYLGLHSQSQLQPVLLDDHQYSAKFRGEVKCEAQKLNYRLSVKKIEAKYQPDQITLKEITLIFIAEIVYKDNVIGLCDDLGARFVSSH